MVVQKINVRPAETLRDKDRAFVRAQDQVDNIGIGDGIFPKWTVAMNCRREPLCKHNWLFGRLIDRELAAEAF